MDFAEVVAQAAPPEDVVHLCLAGHLTAQWRELERQLADVPATTASLGERSPRLALAERMDDLRQRMRAASVPFRVRAMPPREWQRFYAARPVRGKAEAEDAWADRYYRWVTELVSASVTDPAMTPEQVDQLVQVLSGKQWDDLSEACWAINGHSVSIPFSAAASALIAPTAPK